MSKHYARESFYEYGTSSGFDSNPASHGSLCAEIALAMRLNPTELGALRSILRSLDPKGYLTLLPARETLQAKLHQSIELARQRLQPTSTPISVGRVGEA